MVLRAGRFKARDVSRLVNSLKSVEDGSNIAYKANVLPF